jgi:hypothetical protein
MPSQRLLAADTLIKPLLTGPCVSVGHARQPTAAPTGTQMVAAAATAAGVRAEVQAGDLAGAAAAMVSRQPGNAPGVHQHAGKEVILILMRLIPWTRSSWIPSRHQSLGS